jgi:hypothetical protein
MVQILNVITIVAVGHSYAHTRDNNYFAIMPMQLPDTFTDITI